MKTTSTIKILRWTARITGTLIVALTLFIGIGELLEGANKPGTSATFDALMIITFAFWGAGLAGLILALWKEGLGGFISLLCFIIFFLLIGLNPKPDVHFAYPLLIFLVPSVLYICSWGLARKTLNNITGKKTID